MGVEGEEELIWSEPCQSHVLLEIGKQSARARPEAKRYKRDGSGCLIGEIGRRDRTIDNAGGRLADFKRVDRHRSESGAGSRRSEFRGSCFGQRNSDSNKGDRGWVQQNLREGLERNLFVLRREDRTAVGSGADFELQCSNAQNVARAQAGFEGEMVGHACEFQVLTQRLEPWLVRGGVWFTPGMRAQPGAIDVDFRNRHIVVWRSGGCDQYQRVGL